jgi:NDP-sugar pyrophosphorylase family protein
VLQAGVEIGAHAEIARSILVRDSRVGAGTQVHAAVLGEACRVGTGNQLAAGICLAPGTELADACVQFREQFDAGEA